MKITVLTSSDSEPFHLDDHVFVTCDESDLKRVRAEIDGAAVLTKGLSEMVEAGRLTEADIPDDWEWLLGRLRANVEGESGG